MVQFQKAERPGVHKETHYIVPDIGTLSKVIKKSATVQNPSLPRKGTINNLAKCSNCMEIETCSLVNSFFQLFVLNDGMIALPREQKTK